MVDIFSINKDLRVTCHIDCKPSEVDEWLIKLDKEYQGERVFFIGRNIVYRQVKNGKVVR